MIILKNVYIQILLLSILQSGQLSKEIYIFHTDPVVKIHNIVDNEIVSSGTGFIVDKSGVVVTNAHVIDLADELKVITKDNKEYKVSHYYTINNHKDYAILKINSTSNFPIVRLGDSDKSSVGDDIVAVGNPHGFLTHTLTKGIISSKRFFDNVEYLQIDATIAPGSSGGPLFDINRQVIGITTSGFLYENFNFAIPINYIQKVLKYNPKSKPYSDIVSNNKREREKRIREFWSSEEGKDKESYLYYNCKDNLSKSKDLQDLTIQELSNYCGCYINSIKTFIRDGDTENISDKDWGRIDEYTKSCYNN